MPLPDADLFPDESKTSPASLQRTIMVNDSLIQFPGWAINRSRSGALEDCSLIIATFQRPKDIGCLVAALMDLPDSPGEVVVVDGSTDTASEAELLRRLDARSLPFDFIYVRSVAGLTRQRNIGIDVSSGRYVYFLDDDCVPQPGYFSEVRRVFIRDHDRSIGAISGMVINEVNRPVTLRWRLRFALSLVPRLNPGSYYPTGTCIPRGPIKPFSGIRRVDDLAGCSMTFRREVLCKYRFSEFFEGYCQGEDLEIALRIRRDWKIVWCGNANVAHYHAKAGRPASFPKGVMEVRNRYFIWKRNSDGGGLVHKLRFWLDMLFLIAMDVAWFAFHPRQFHWLSHAAGVAWGIVGCLISPPRYEEPASNKKYGLRRVAFGE